MTYILLYLELRLWMRRQWLGHERRHEKANHHWHRTWHWSNQIRVRDILVALYPERLKRANVELVGGGV